MTYAVFLENGSINSRKAGTWNEKEPRDSLKNNKLGNDLVYITRFQPSAELAVRDAWRVQTLYNTRYQTGPNRSEKDDDRVGGQLNIITTNNVVINLSKMLLGTSNNWRDVSDLDVSYDAKKIVFSTRDSVKGFWHLYEIKLGNAKDYSDATCKDLTEGVKYDCIDPCYRPDGKIIFTANRTGALNEYEMQLNELLHVMDPEAPTPTNSIRQLSFFQSGDYNPMIMNDGRLLWMRYEHHGPQDYFPLMVSRPDGTLVEEMFGFKGKGDNLENNKDNIRVFFEFTQLPEPDGRIISTAMWHFYTWEAGALVDVDPRKGPTDFIPPHNFTPRIETSAHGSEVGRFRTPFAYKSGDETIILAAYSHGPVSSRGSKPIAQINGYSWNNECTPDFGIWQLSWTDNAKTNLIPYREIVNTEREADIDPKPLIYREKPPIIPSYYDKTETSGELLCLNVYENSLITRAFGPDPKGGQQFREDGNKMDIGWELLNHTDSLSGVPESYRKIDKVRVLQGLPVHALGNTHRRSAHYYHEPKRILGDVPVYDDGSFRVRIPTGIPVHFQTLDTMGRVVSTMQSWVYLNPTYKKMQTRVCIGCHEKRGQTVPNGDGLAIAATKEATVLTNSVNATLSESHMYHFVRDVYPILRKHCIKCHNNTDPSDFMAYKAPAGDLDLSDDVSPIYNVAYDSLRPWMRTDDSLRRSELLRMLTRARDVKTCGMPRAPKENVNAVVFKEGVEAGGSKEELTKEEWNILAEWMEIGALFRYYGDGQVQTSLPAASELSYKTAFTYVFNSNGCKNVGCHGEGAYTATKYYLNLRNDFSDFGGGPIVMGENSINMSWPGRSRLLRAPTNEGEIYTPQCPAIWTKDDDDYKALQKGIEAAQDTFIGHTNLIDILDVRCNTQRCHKENGEKKTAQVIPNVDTFTKTAKEWKFTIMKMVMYVHRHGFRPESNGLSKTNQKGWSIRPPEAALVYRVLTGKPVLDPSESRTAKELYLAARALRYPEGETINEYKYTQANIREAQKLLWTALLNRNDVDTQLEKLIRLELGVLFTQYLDPTMEDDLYEAMKKSRPVIPEPWH